MGLLEIVVQRAGKVVLAQLTCRLHANARLRLLDEPCFKSLIVYEFFLSWGIVRVLVVLDF